MGRAGMENCCPIFGGWRISCWTGWRKDPEDGMFESVVIRAYYLGFGGNGLVGLVPPLYQDKIDSA